MRAMVLFLALATPGPALAQAATPPAAAVANTSFMEPDGDRVMQISTVVPAPPAEVWKALSTAEGWKRLGVKMAAVDFQVGGMIETNYRADAQPGERSNIKNLIVAYLPERLLVIRNVQAPAGFANAEAFSRTATIIELEPWGGGQTRVRLSGVGFRPGGAYDDLYGKFTAGNAYSLDLLRRSFTPED